MTKSIKIPIRSAGVERPKNVISAHELQALLASGAKPALIDVRSEPEYRIAHLEGAVLATRDLVEEIFTKWPKDKAIVIYDHFGRDAMNAVRALSSREFTNAQALEGGIDKWSEIVDPLLPRY